MSTKNPKTTSKLPKTGIVPKKQLTTNLYANYFQSRSSPMAERKLEMKVMISSKNQKVEKTATIVKPASKIAPKERPRSKNS